MFHSKINTFTKYQQRRVLTVLLKSSKMLQTDLTERVMMQIIAIFHQIIQNPAQSCTKNRIIVLIVLILS